jgi:hypothetical protein
MKLTDQGGSSFPQATPGSHVARSIKVIDLGTQKNEFDGKPSLKRQLLISFELPNELLEEGDYAGQPFSVSKRYTASLGEKATLRKDLESWRGRAFTEEELKGFDITNIVGKPCMVSIVHNEKGKAKVTSVMAMPKGMICPPQVNQSVVFSLDEFKEAQFGLVPQYFQELIKKSPEYMEIMQGGESPLNEVHDDNQDEDIPF